MAPGRGRPAIRKKQEGILSMSAIANLAATKARADSRANFERFIAGRHADGWTEADIAEYTESIRLLMGDDDAAALALFPAGTYRDAEQARAGARAFWAAN